MSIFYFDETIRDRGNFIIGALVIAEQDVSAPVAEQWHQLGLNPELAEYKSSDLKESNGVSILQREIVVKLLQELKIAFTVAPLAERSKLGKYCTSLLIQLANTGFLQEGEHVLYLDQNIRLDSNDTQRLRELNISPFPNSDSRKIGGIQVADHAAHALGGMLLEEMGLITKQVRAGENSGYSPGELMELGFELWTSLRYALIGRSEHIDGLSPHPDDPANPYFRIDGIGLYIAPTCSAKLSQHAKSRFGVNYLGCIH